MPLHPSLIRFYEVLGQERRRRQLEVFNGDTAAIQRGRQVEQTRVRAWRGYQRYEPKSEIPNGD